MGEMFDQDLVNFIKPRVIELFCNHKRQLIKNRAILLFTGLFLRMKY